MAREVLKAFEYRIDTTAADARLLAQHCGHCRFVYNRFLAMKIQQYKDTGSSDSFVKLCDALVALKREDEFAWLAAVNSQALIQALKDLDAAFQNFYAGRTRYPRFKRRGDKNSFRCPQHVSLRDGRIHIPKFKRGLKLIMHRPLAGEIRSCTIKRTPAGDYYAAILCKVGYEPTMPKTGKAIGIDLGLSHLVVASDGTKLPNHRYTIAYQARLAAAQQHLSRKQHGSQAYENQRRKVAQIHEKISNCRKDTLHKLSRSLVEEYDVICVETLGIKCMIRNPKLAKHIADAGWGELCRLLEYKAAWEEKTVVRIEQFYPSSKTCSCCGHKLSELPLSVREWACPQCGVLHDRDINAAKNILSIGIQMLSVGTTEYTGGANGVHSTSAVAKPEAAKYSS